MPLFLFANGLDHLRTLQIMGRDWCFVYAADRPFLLSSFAKNSSVKWQDNNKISFVRGIYCQFSTPIRDCFNLIRGMAHRIRPTEHRRVGSKRVCQEKVVCNGARAELECLQCSTKQCKDCETVLHKKSKFAHHDRTKIEQPSFPNGVQPCGMWCNPINSAEYSCVECKCVLCADCNRDFHKGKLTKHHRKLIPKPEVCIEIESDDQFHSAGLGLLSPSEEEFGIPGTLAVGYRHRTQTTEQPQSLSSNSPPSFDDFHSIPVPTTGPTAGLPQLGSPPAFVPIGKSSSGLYLGSLNSARSDSSSGDYFNTVNTITGAYRSLEKESPSPDQVAPSDEDIARFDPTEADALDFESGHFTSVDSQDLYEPTSTETSTPGTVLRNRKEGNKSVQQSPVATASSPPGSLGVAIPKDPKSRLNPPPSQIISRQPVTVMAHRHSSESKSKPVAKIQGSPSQSLTISATEEEDTFDLLGTTDIGRKNRKEVTVRASHHHRESASSANAALETNRELMKKMVLKDHAPGFLLVDENEKLQVCIKLY